MKLLPTFLQGWDLLCVILFRLDPLMSVLPALRLIDKKVRDNSNADELPTVHVDPLSLSSLLSQGFEEGPARRALRFAEMFSTLEGVIELKNQCLSATDTCMDPSTRCSDVSRHAESGWHDIIARTSVARWVASCSEHSAIFFFHGCRSRRGQARRTSAIAVLSLVQRPLYGEED